MLTSVLYRGFTSYLNIKTRPSSSSPLTRRRGPRNFSNKSNMQTSTCTKRHCPTSCGRCHIKKLNDASPGVMTPEGPTGSRAWSSASGSDGSQPRDEEDGGGSGFVCHGGDGAWRGCLPETFPLLPAEPAGDGGPGGGHRLLDGTHGPRPEPRRA